MENVKIAIIDTGIDLSDNTINKFIHFNRDIQIDKFELEYKSIDDINGHGTLCAKTIIKLCSNVDIYPIKIFDYKGQTSSLKLIDVLNKLLLTDIKIINISASSLNCSCIEEIHLVCKKLYEKGKIIVCSQHNVGTNISSIPTRFNEVIGVRGIENISNDNDFLYNPYNEIQMCCNSKFHFVKFKDKVTDFGKNSRAAAVASGIIANIVKVNNNINFKQLEYELMKRSIRNIANLNEFKLKKSSYSLSEYNIILKLVKIINENFSEISVNCNLLKKYDLFNNLTNIGRDNAYKFLNLINYEFSIDLNYNEITIDELRYLDNVLNIITNKLH